MAQQAIISQLFEETSQQFDTRKQLNRASEYSFNEGFMEQLQKEGLTLEMLDEIKDNVPIFKYMTQITIHGQFPETQIRKIHGYKNCIRNENGTLGIRYNAIDVAKKKELDKMLTLVKRHKELPLPHLHRDSSSMEFELRSTKIEVIKEMYDRIDTSLFYGRKYAYKSVHPFYGVFYALIINIGVFKTDMLWPIFTNWTGMTRQQYEELKLQVDTQEKKEEDERKEAHKIAREKCQEHYDAAIQQLTYLKQWDGKFHSGIVLVSGLRNVQAMGFQFLQLQQGAFGRINRGYQDQPTLENFNPKTYREHKAIMAADLKLYLKDEQWFVFQEGDQDTAKKKPAPLAARSVQRAARSAQTAVAEGLELMPYKKGVALFGNTKPYADKLGKNGFGGSPNYHLIHPVTQQKTFGWIFSPSKTTTLESFFNITLMDNTSSGETQSAAA